MAEDSLSVLFICSWYPSKEHNTLGNFIQRHACAVAGLHKVTVLTAVESASNSYEVNHNEGVTEHIAYFKKKLPFFSYRKTLVSAYRKLKQEQKFDIVHLHVAYPAAVILPYLKAPYLITEHFSGYHAISGFKWSRFKKRLTLKALNNARYILPVSGYLAKSIRNFGAKGKYIKIPNVVDSGLFYYKEVVRPSVFTFLHVSSLEERSKNITGLLKGFELLHQKGIDFKLLIGGDGDLEELKLKISSTSLPSAKVEIFGESPSSEIALKMQNCHCLVMFSHFETQSCTVLEALCCGVPVVSSAVGGIPEEIDEANGLLVESGNTTALADALEKITLVKDQFNPVDISKKAIESYSNKSVARKISDIYFNVLNKGS